MRLLDRLIAERAEITDQQTAIMERGAERDDPGLTKAEDENLVDLTERASELDDRIEQLRSIADANAKAAQTRAEITPTGDTESGQAATGNVVVRSEPNTYRPDGDHSYLRDLFYAQILHDPAAGGRIAQHQREMAIDHADLQTRDGVVANVTNLVVPQYLTDLAAPLMRAGRPFANICTSLTLPGDGMTVNIHRTTTGTSAAIQASENASVSETDLLDTTLTVNVNTIAGQQDMSRQMVERGTGIEELVMADMVSAYNTTLDSQLLVGTGSSGQHKGITVSGFAHNDNDVDDASPTAVECYQEIIESLGLVAQNRYRPADVIVMHPRRWTYLFKGLDGSNRPLFGYTSASARNPFGVGDAADYGIVGEIAGVPVITDANIPTTYGAGTEDVIIAARREDLLLWEQPGAPMMLRFEEGQAAANNSASLTVKLVAYGYSAFTAERYPLGITVYQGTSLIAP